VNKFDHHKTPFKAISAELMSAYLSGSLSPAMQHAVEKHLLDNPFEAEAMEGFAENTSALNAVDALEEKLAIRIKEWEGRAIIPLWRHFLPYAASFILLLVATIAAVYFYGPVGSQDGISLKGTDHIPLDSLSRPAPRQPIVNSANMAKVGISKDKEPASFRDDNSIKKAPRNPVESARKKENEDLDRMIADIPRLLKSSQREIPQATPEPKAMAELDDTVEEELVKVASGVAVNTEKSAKKAIRSNIVSQTLDSETSLEEVAGKLTVNAKNQLIKGQVTDAETGENLPGVSVYLKNAKTGVNTDLDGNFSIKATIGDVLVITLIGMDKKEVEITDETLQKIELSTDIRQLSEVVITGYGRSEKKVESYQNAQPRTGMKAFKQYLKEQLQYPASAMENETEGKVKLKLSISAAGRIVNIEVVNSVSESCDTEAIRLIRFGPSWEAAEKNGEAVESTVKIKVVFKLPKK
jgi:TonB family protein